MFQDFRGGKVDGPLELSLFLVCSLENLKSAGRPDGLIDRPSNASRKKRREREEERKKEKTETYCVRFEITELLFTSWTRTHKHASSRAMNLLGISVSLVAVGFN